MMLVEDTPVPAAALPVAQFKAHLKLGTGFDDDAVQDAVLESFLRAALAAVEGRTGKILLTRQFSWTIQAWRDDTAQSLPVAPVVNLIGLTLTDADGTQTPQSLDDFILNQDHHRPVVQHRRNTCLPRVPTKGSVDVVFMAGFAPDFDDLPDDLAQAILLLASHYYENRNATGMAGTALPFGVSVLIERYKTLRIVGGLT